MSVKMLPPSLDRYNENPLKYTMFALVGSTEMPMSYQHWVEQEAPVALIWDQLVPPLVVFQTPRSPNVALLCTAAYTVAEAEAAMPRLIRPKLDVGKLPVSLLQLAPVSVDL